MGQRFAWYAEQFDTVELNTTFYRLPAESTVRRWAELAPPGFLYAAKVGSFATHRKKLADPDIWLPRHLERAELLGEHLGPNVFQLPPRWRRNDDRLAELLIRLPRHIRWVVELRDASWLAEPVFDLLRGAGVALCVHDLLADHPMITTADFVYVRFHGPDARERPYHGRYGSRRLFRWAGWLSELLAAGLDVYCYFNNDYAGAAVADARWMRAAVGC